MTPPILTVFTSSVPMILWRGLLLIYPKIDVRLPQTFGFSKRFVHALPAAEIEDAVQSFRCFPPLVSDLTDHAAGIEYEVIQSDRPLSTLSAMGKGCWWPSPTDVQLELHRHMATARHHSVFVFWPQNNLQAGTSVRSAGWGLGMGASSWSMGATYATVANIQTAAWQVPRPGEVWLHEWLHGVCRHFAHQGHPMPDGDADGADRHGYARSPTIGWTDYYRDLMSGRVMENGEPTGIPVSAWRIPLA